MKQPTQTALITGGARGLGLGIAKRLAADGRRIILWDIGYGGFSSETAGFNPLLRQEVDVADLASVTRAFDDALAVAGRIDIVINNAGINGPIAPSWEYPVDQWQRVLDIDLTGVFHCCRAAIPHMKANGYGRIVNIASISGKEGNPNAAAYSASKAGVIGLTKAIAADFITRGIRANAICPGTVESPSLEQRLRDTGDYEAARKAFIARQPIGRIGRAEEIAALVVYLASDESSYTTGVAHLIDGGWTNT